MTDGAGKVSGVRDRGGLGRRSPHRARDVHPGLASLLASLTHTDDGVPDSASWERLVLVLDQQWRDHDRISRELAEGRRGRSSFENLFRISPVPIMEQDYSVMERWMEGLRADGATSTVEHLGDDTEAIRSVVPMIRIVAANPAAVKAVGLPLEELIGPVDPRIVNEGAIGGWLTQIEAVWDRRPVARASFSAATADGRAFDAESILAAPIVDGEPDFSRAVFTLLDVTGHRAEERRMQELVEAKNRFLAAVSHEIRTPLTALVGFAHLLEDGDLEDGDRDAMLSSVAIHAREVSGLVEDLLVASRGEGVGLDVSDEAVDAVDELATVLTAGGSFTEKVSVDIRAGGGAWGDPGRVRQVLRNLLTNAERYGGPNVRVVVDVVDGMVSVDVTDDGPAIPHREWQRIFEPYHRVSSGAGRRESVGIGLAVSRQLAELMGGTLDYSHDGERSVFRLRLRRR